MWLFPQPILPSLGARTIVPAASTATIAGDRNCLNIVPLQRPAYSAGPIWESSIKDTSRNGTQLEAA